MALSNVITEYIQDCEPYWLAVRIGIFGVIITIIADFIYESLLIFYIDSTYISVQQLAYLLSIPNGLHFIGGIMGSVGFVGVFSMKRSLLGLVFPLKFIAGLLITSGIFWIYLSGGITYLILNNIQTAIGYVFAFVGGLVLLTIWRKSVNTYFLISYALLYMFGGLLSYFVFQLLFGSSLPINSGFDHLIGSLPSLVLGLIVSLMNIIFFYLEGRAGCIALDEIHVSYTT